MSGFEVVGVTLAILPIVLYSVDAYKDSIRRVGTTLRKRKYVEKLARALLLQQQILEETVKIVVLATGCDNIAALEDNPFEYFGSEDVRERVEDYLGQKNCIAFICLLTANNDILKKVAKNLSGLVPSHQVRALCPRWAKSDRRLSWLLTDLNRRSRQTTWSLSSTPTL